MEKELTDLERFIALYKSLGIECKVNISPKDGHRLHINKDDRYIVLRDSYDDDTTDDERFVGYMGFYSDVVFDKDGKFRNQGFWE